MIFYFTGTGNSRWVAEALGTAFDEPLVSIADALNEGKEYTHLHLLVSSGRLISLKNTNDENFITLNIINYGYSKEKSSESDYAT